MGSHRHTLAPVSLAGLLALGCAGPLPPPQAGLSSLGPSGDVAVALERYEASAEPEPRQLTRIAEAVLERELRADEPARRRAALTALGAAGNYARPLLTRLAETAHDYALRTVALKLLARLGDGPARTALRKRLDASDPALEAAALEAVEGTELSLLLPRVQAPSAVVREAALGRLARAPASGEVRLALVAVLRQDPIPMARAAAAAALVAQGSEALPALEEALTQAERSVRMAAIRALVRVDAARAAVLLDPRLSTDPSDEGIEAARALLLALPAEAAPPAAHSQLARALISHDAGLRARAAVAVGSLSGWPDPALLHRRITAEPVRAVRLSLALSLGMGEADAWVALLRLMAGTDVVAAQAARELAVDGHVPAVDALSRLGASKTAAVRRTAYRALARDLRKPHEVRRALLDEDASVRVAAAAAILSARG